MASEGNLAGSLAQGTENSQIVPLPLDGKTSSRMVGFFDVPVSLAVPHLVGCTSIIVISNKGAWANHIWELPTFTPEFRTEDDEGEPLAETLYLRPGAPDEDSNYSPTFPYGEQLAYFRTHALERLHTSYSPLTQDHLYGLDQLRNSDKAETEDWQGHLFDGDSELKVFMFIPYVHVDDEEDPNYNNEKPANLP